MRKAFDDVLKEQFNLKGDNNLKYIDPKDIIVSMLRTMRFTGTVISILLAGDGRDLSRTSKPHQSIFGILKVLFRDDAPPMFPFFAGEFHESAETIVALKHALQELNSIQEHGIEYEGRHISVTLYVGGDQLFVHHLSGTGTLMPLGIVYGAEFFSLSLALIPSPYPFPLPPLTQEAASKTAPSVKYPEKAAWTSVLTTPFVRMYHLTTRIFSPHSQR